MQKVLFVLVDGLRYDMISRVMPFSDGLDHRGSLEETFGYVGFRAAAFAGLSAKESGLQFAWMLHRGHGRPEHRSDITPYRLPKVWPDSIRQNFIWSERKLPYSPLAYDAGPSIFELLDQESRKWAYRAWPHNMPSEITTLDAHVEILSKLEQYDLVFYHFSLPDFKGHADGPNSKAYQDAIMLCDKAIENLSRALPGYEIIVCGDHGFVPVSHHYNATSWLNEQPEVQNEDYVVMLDSTAVRMWALTERGHDLCERLDGIEGRGHVVTDEEMERWGARQDQRYGDAIWLADPGTIVWPNYWGRKRPELGAHGYAPNALDNVAGIASTIKLQRSYGKMPDLFGLLRTGLGV